MCGCGKVRVPAFLQQKRKKMMMQKQQQQRNIINQPQGETLAQVRPQAPPIKKPVNRQQMMQKRRQALKKLNQLRQKRKNMNSAFDHRYYLRY